MVESVFSLVSMLIPNFTNRFLFWNKQTFNQFLFCFQHFICQKCLILHIGMSKLMFARIFFAAILIFVVKTTEKMKSVKLVSRFWNMEQRNKCTESPTKKLFFRKFKQW